VTTQDLGTQITVDADAPAGRKAKRAASTTQWIERWGDTIAAKPELPGVWRRKDGGFRIRGRTRDPKSNERREVNRALVDCKRAREAATVLEAELAAIRGRGEEAVPFPRFATYAVDLLERKIATGVHASASTRRKWADVLETHLIPRFGDWYLDKITKRDIEAWKVSVGESGLAPTTGNSLLAILKTILSSAAADYEGLADPSAKVEPFSTKTHRTYSVEQTNAFKLEDVVPFLDEMRLRWPDHYAMVYLGMWTGWRPSMLRPLRRRGPSADINWQTGELHARRSHTLGATAMTGTKNGLDQVLRLPPQVIEVLRWHVERLDLENEKRAKRSPENAAAIDASELMFPAKPTKWNKGGGFRNTSCLRKPFADVSKAIGLAYKVTPRALRRSFQDLTRAASVSDVVARAVCGHRTPAMTAHYSTVDLDEREGAMAKIIDLATARRDKVIDGERASETAPRPRRRASRAD
jgi:hypothetical protein